MKLNVFISCFLAGIWQSVQVSSQFTAFAHGNPHKDNIYQNPQPYAAEHLPYHPQPALHPEPAHPYVAPHPGPVVHHEPAYHAEPAPVHPHEPTYHADPSPAYPQQQPYQQPYGYQHPGYYQPSYYSQHPQAYQAHPEPAYQGYQPHHPQQAAYPAHPHPSHPMHEAPAVTTPAPPPATTPAPETTAVAHPPKYLGTFKNPSHDVEGDIFMLDEHTLYIQGFSFDGEAPDAYFWSDGVPIPYYTRADPNVTMNLRKYHKEDVVLMLPKEKPTLKALGHFQVWCNMFNVVFGEFDMKDAWHA